MIPYDFFIFGYLQSELQLCKSTISATALPIHFIPLEKKDGS